MEKVPSDLKSLQLEMDLKRDQIVRPNEEAMMKVIDEEIQLSEALQESQKKAEKEEQAMLSEALETSMDAEPSRSEQEKKVNLVDEGSNNPSLEVNQELIVEKVIDKFFEDNPNCFVQHHIDSYNELFAGNGIHRIFREKNPIKIRKNPTSNDDFKLKCDLWLGGKNGENIYFGKPIIHDDNRRHFMYPNEARLRNLSYDMTIHYDVEIEYFINNDENNGNSTSPSNTETIEKVLLGRFPIMLMSDLCVLNGISPSLRFELGECKNDRGGYFIIDGKEKCIVSQEKIADNTLNVRDKVNEIYSHSCGIRSISEDPSKPRRNLEVKIMSPNTKYTNNQIVVDIPNVRKPVPLFIVMRALGIVSDKQIIEMCLLDMERNKELVDVFIPSIHDAGKVFDQEVALAYIGSLTKGKTKSQALEIMCDYFLPHIGVTNFREKAFFLGHMVKKLLLVFTKKAKPTDRDSFRFKRVETPGTLIFDLFNEYYTIQHRNIFKRIDSKFHYNQGNFEKEFETLVTTLNYRDYFSEKIVEAGFKRAFKGNWGAASHTKRLGLIQDLNRLTYNSTIAHVRKINLEMDSSAKVVAPRHLHSSQWGIIDPLDTPDGGNVGLHKHLAITTHITSSTPSEDIIKMLESQADITLLRESFPENISRMTKVFVNGKWVGVVSNPLATTGLLKQFRRSNSIPLYTSISWFVGENAIEIFTDPGRLCRPLFYIEDGKASYDSDLVRKQIATNDFNWSNLVIDGFSNKQKKSVIEYIDTSEAESSLISMRHDTLEEKRYTHVEIHPSLALGVMGNQVVFPENNPLSRNLFACGQMKQAISLYHSNFQTRIDKMGVVLNNGQLPLVKSRFLKKISNEEHPYGENVVVAIMCYTGYNVEDSILFNEGSVKRGLFRTTYFNSYEDREDSSNVGETEVDTKFTNIQAENVSGIKPGFNYGDLDDNGLIRENTMVDEKSIMIGKITTHENEPGISIDKSVSAKKGQRGFVDKAFMSQGEEGFRIAKIRVRDERVPSIGDKFCSRCGQKGTIGLIIPEESMPFTGDGMKPDIIINPHAIPSRMTIGQLVETQMGKACSLLGGYGDCTAFKNKGPKNELYGKILTDAGFHSSACEVMYNGETGERIEANIFIGPTYYMRLKHMVKDKINYRARGPRTALTRQTVQGRANDGGLRIGEMERDCIISHGATKFLQESMLERGDDYLMAICDLTGMVAIYNENHNLMLSPFADGPIRFSGSLDEDMTINNVTKYGRSFSVIRVPYAFKLLMQELQTMNIQMRVVTENNIDSITSMSFSDNVVNLLQKDKTDVREEKLNKGEDDFDLPFDNINDDSSKEDISTLILPDKETEENQSKIIAKMAQLTKTDPKSIGWEINTGFDDEVVWNSLVIPDETDGFESDTWFNEEHGRNDPDKPPKGWDQNEAIYDDNTQIPSDLISNLLRKNPVPGNWKIVIEYLKKAHSMNNDADNVSPTINEIPSPPEVSSQIQPMGADNAAADNAAADNAAADNADIVSPTLEQIPSPAEQSPPYMFSEDIEKNEIAAKIEKANMESKSLLTTIDDNASSSSNDSNLTTKNIKLN